MMNRIHARLAAAALLSVVVMGCNKSNKPKPPEESGPAQTVQQGGGNTVGVGYNAVGRKISANELRQIWVFYDSYCETNGKGPSKLADLTELRQQGSKFYEAIQEGDVVIRWKVNTRALGEEERKKVWGYARYTPTERGPVVTVGGEMFENVQAGDFKNMPKAGVEK
jgi:hypothetical protein